MFEIVTLPILVCTLVSLNPGIKNEKKTAQYFLNYTQQYEVPVEFAVTIAYTESKLRHLRKPNRTNDYGIMQVHKPIWEPHCKNYMRRTCDLRNLRDNIMMGVYILGVGMNKGGDPIKYYAGKRKKKNYIKYKKKFNLNLQTKVLPALKSCLTAEVDY